MQQVRTLTSLPFLTAFAVLALNDFVLKPHFHNWLTGKLSDFAGLFVFPLFLTVLVPQRKGRVYTFTLIGFVFWKSAYSQSLIAAFNSLLTFRIDRTVDLTDLVALCVLPLSWMAASEGDRQKPIPGSLRKAAALIMAVLSIFVFGATSTAAAEQVLEYNKRYEFAFPRSELVKRLGELNLDSLKVLQAGKDTEDSYLYRARLDKTICTSAGGRPDMKAYSLPQGKSVLVLLSIRYNCNAKVPGDQEMLLGEFEERIVKPLRR